MIPSKPTIPRRNSASKHEVESLLLNNRSHFDLDDDLDDDEFKLTNELERSLNLSGSTAKKYDTMPNLRTSAKNRKKLEKLFAIGANENEQIYSDGNEKNNLYLSKLKAEKQSDMMSSSRYTPSNPESGVFSMSDYDQM